MTSPVAFTLDAATAPKIAEHLERCDRGFVPPLSTRTDIDRYARKIRDQATSFEAWADGKLVGLVAAYFNDEARRVAYVSNVSVEADYRRTGIGSDLMARCIQQAIERGFDGIELEVDATNLNAIALYLKHGFTMEVAPGRTPVMRLETGRGQA